MKFMKWLLVIVTICLANEQSFAQEQTLKLTPGTRMQVVDSLSSSLRKNYVFLDTAIKMGDYIKKRLKGGTYNAFTNPNQFAQALNADLHAVYDDRHLLIRYDPQMEKSLQDTSNTERDLRHGEDMHFAQQQNFGFRKIEILSGNIGYVYFDRFFSVNERSSETVNSVFSFLKNTNALIIDLRINGGGDPEMVKYICSYFFKTKTHINDLYERRKNKTDQFWTEPVNNSDTFTSIPIFVLVSRHTFSGAEEFSYDLQSLHRATIIGETTGGGAHPVSPEMISNGFIGNIPFARAINPVTGKNWEAIGVKPDVQINADSALDAATLSYYDHQINTSRDSSTVKTIKWSRDMLNAKLHPFNTDTTTLKTYIGNYADRIITFENSRLYLKGSDNKKLKLIALSQTFFKLDNTDNLKLEFLKNPEGKVNEIAVIFDDGFVAKYKRKE